MESVLFGAEVVGTLLLQGLGTEGLKRKVAQFLQREEQTQKVCSGAFEVKPCTQSFRGWGKVKPPGNKEQMRCSIRLRPTMYSTLKLLKMIGWFLSNRELHRKGKAQILLRRQVPAEQCLIQILSGTLIGSQLAPHPRPKGQRKKISKSPFSLHLSPLRIL